MNEGTDRPGPRNRVLQVPYAVALALIAVLVAAASAAAFGESYRGLFDWAHEHGLTGAWAVIWPLQVDVFIAVGELALFVALVDRWAPRSRTAAWAVTGAGLAVSVAGNVGHVTGHSLADRATAAVPPLAAAFALAVALGVLKRVVEAHHEAADERGRDATGPPVPATQAVPAAASVAAPLPGLREIQRRRKCSQGTAQKIRAELAAYARGRGEPTAAPAPVTVPAGNASSAKDGPAGTFTQDVPAGIPPDPPSVPAGTFNGQAVSHD